MGIHSGVHAPLGAGGGGGIPSSAKLAGGNGISDDINQSNRPLYGLQYIHLTGSTDFTNTAIVGDETVASKPVGTSSITVAAGKLAIAAGDIWTFSLSNGSSYEFGTILTATTGIVFDTSGHGRHLFFTVADTSVVCLSGREKGTDCFNNLGFNLHGSALTGIKYYVSTSGDDSHDGSIGTPFSTITKAMSVAVSGDCVYLKKGDTFREQVLLTDGVNVFPYGTGSAPIVSGADLLSNASFALTSGQTYTYEISLPSIPVTTNPYVSVSNSDVLMVWEDNVRMGERFEASAKTSIAGVEATAGTHWWDSVNKKLYIHPSDNSNPTTNGKVYEASVRTLALHGGNAFYVYGIIAEKAYAKTMTGQQGYQLLGYKSGHYHKCSAYRGWNHLAGVANTIRAELLLFEDIYAEDVSIITATAAATHFIGYKNGYSTNKSTVIFRNCFAKQPSKHATNQNAGFYSHGDSCDCVYDSVSAENTYYGAQAPSDSNVSFTGRHLFKNVCIGAYDDLGIPIGHVTVFGASLVGVTGRKTGSSFDDIIAIDCVGGASSYNFSTRIIVPITNSIIARSTTPASHTGSFGVQGLVQSEIAPSNCSFFNVGTALSTRVRTSNNNNFYGCTRVVSDNQFYSPTYHFNLSTWRASSGQDLLSTNTNPAYPASFFTSPTISNPSSNALTSGTKIPIGVDPDEFSGLYISYTGKVKLSITPVSNPTDTTLVDAHTYSLADSHAMRVATGWVYGTANTFYNADGTPKTLTGAALKAAAVGPLLWIGDSKWLAFKSASEAKRALKVPVA